MIFILGGTTEGRELALILQQHGFANTLSVASALGRSFATENENIVSGELDEKRLSSLIEQGGCQVILDATHPYTEIIKNTAREVAKSKKIPYLRYQRPAEILPEGPNLFRTADYEEGKRVLEQSSGGIFFMIGVRRLRFFQTLWTQKHRPVWVKVLPTSESLRTCEDLGLRPEQIYAFHTAGSKELISVLLKESGAEWLVTKNSGSIGGTGLKIAAAMELKKRILIIDRPPVEADVVFDNYPAVLDWFKKNYESGFQQC